VPPTAGLVAKFFGVGHMATLFGVVMLTHQVGGFLGAWLGGQVFQATGSYDIVWMIDIGLAVAPRCCTCRSARRRAAAPAAARRDVKAHSRGAGAVCTGRHAAHLYCTRPLSPVQNGS
jgi:hypothetical protein